MKVLNLSLKDNPYSIYIGAGIQSDSQLVSSYCSGEKVLIVTNDLVAPLYLEKLKANFGRHDTHHVIIDDGEVHKNKQSFFKILDYLLENGFKRNDTLIALGGGVIGDLAGFAAASYQRGMNLVQVPTTLLSQVDSSVGGKTAINHELGKNMIGSFYQPKAVLIDSVSLDTLPDREYFSGLGEIIKYALLGEKRIADLLQSSLMRIKQRDQSVIEEIIYLSCQKKAEIVEKDEKEKGERALLNLGHTFAHALETLTEYKYYLHGEAVALGILMALDFSLRKDLIDSELNSRYTKIIEALGLPTRIEPKLTVNAILRAMKKDKKNINSAYRLVLVQSKKLTPSCFISEEKDSALLKGTLSLFGAIA